MASLKTFFVSRTQMTVTNSKNKHKHDMILQVHGIKANLYFFPVFSYYC